MVDPAEMCDRHLLGEHAETHMLAGNLRLGRSIDGFIERDLLEPASLHARHERLVAEMAARGFRHASPLAAVALDHVPLQVRAHEVDVPRAHRELVARCDACRERASARRA